MGDVKRLIVLRHVASPSAIAHLRGTFDARTFSRRGSAAEPAGVRQLPASERTALRLTRRGAFSAAREMPDELRGRRLQVQVHVREVPQEPSRVPSASLPKRL